MQQHTRRGTDLATVVVAALVVLVVPACAAPSGGNVVTQGTYVGEYSVLNSPITYAYDGTAGERVNLTLFDNRASYGTTPPVVELFAPGGAAVPVVATRPFTTIHELPVTGRYSIRIRYPLTDLGVLTYSLSVSRDEDRGPAGLGPIVPFGSLIPGQVVTFTYAGTAGEQLNRLGVDHVVAPDGTSVPNNGRRPAQVTLPVTGTYRIEVSQPGAVLSRDLPPIPVGPGRTSVPTLLPGQNVDLLYPGAAGETVNLGSTTNVSVQFRNPDDTPFDPAEILPSTRYTLPAAGLYRVVARGGSNTVGTSIWLSPDLDLGVLGAGSYPTPTRSPGQAFTAGLAATAGSSFRLRTLDPPGVKPRLVVRTPSGVLLPGVADPDVPFTPDPWATFTTTETGVHSILVFPADVGAFPGDDLITLQIEVP